MALTCRTARAAAIALAAAAVACSRESPPGERAGPEAVAENEAAGAPEETNGLSPADLPAGPVLIAVNQRPNSAFPMANNLGRFRIENGCLVLDMAGAVFTPIFPGPATFEEGAEPGVRFADERIMLGGDYAVGGGRIELPDESVAITEDVMRRCPRRYYLVSGVEEA